MFFYTTVKLNGKKPANLYTGTILVGLTSRPDNHKADLTQYK